MNNINQNLLKDILNTFSPSGEEDDIRAFLKNEVKDYVDEIIEDNMGNLIAIKKGKNNKKIMLSAHMDQIGFMVTYIDKKGFIRFTNIGGINPFVSLGQRVIFKNKLVGVIGSEPVKDKNKMSLDKMYVDIGASTKEEAEELVSIGDSFIYHSEPIMDEKKIVSQCLDDKIGCYILLETLKNIKDNENELYFVFSTQEEVGLRGAKTSAYRIDPDYGFAIDVTMTGDTPKAHKMSVELNKGVAIKARDNSIIINPKVKNYMVDIAKENNIPYQIEVLEFGGTDAGAIHLNKSGVLAGAISIPTRYIHSTCEMVSNKDIIDSINYTIKLLEKDINI